MRPYTSNDFVAFQYSGDFTFSLFQRNGLKYPTFYRYYKFTRFSNSTPYSIILQKFASYVTISTLKLRFHLEIGIIKVVAAAQTRLSNFVTMAVAAQT